jgi:hypothetical protein
MRNSSEAFEKTNRQSLNHENLALVIRTLHQVAVAVTVGMNRSFISIISLRHYYCYDYFLLSLDRNFAIASHPHLHHLIPLHPFLSWA